MASVNNDDPFHFGRWVGHNLLFSDVIESDGRVPVLTFTVPDSLLGLLRVEGGNKFGLVAPQIEFWLALAATLALGAFFGTCMSCIIWQFIVLPRKKNKRVKQTNESITPYLVGFGIVMPLCVIYPFYANRYFCVKSKIIKFLNAVAQIVTFFRCSEAMFGFLPDSVDDSLTNLIVYNAFPVEVKFNKGVMKSTWAHVSYNFVHWVKYIIVLGLYSSILLAYDYEPYPNEEGTRLQDINLLTGFSSQQLINNTLVAMLFQVYLTTFGYGLNFITSLCGVQQIPMMLNPIFESRSPSDFWGRRWNMVVHGILKRGVYKPVRTRYSRLAASTATFLASGLFHEWILWVMFYPDSGENIIYAPGYGRNTLFFIWNAVLIGLEYAIGGAAIFQLFRKHLPLSVISLMVASTALPMAHWFTNDYVRSDFFEDGQVGFPLIVRVLD